MFVCIYNAYIFIRALRFALNTINFNSESVFFFFEQKNKNLTFA